jgi:16S rRNA (uracil1498-N3)-methyltransferase
MSRPPIRLYVDAPLVAGVAIALDQSASHYLVTVMRQAAGDVIELFNGHDGAWSAELVDAHRKHAALLPRTLALPQEVPPDLWLLCAPLKKERLNWTAEKACELGVSRFVPVQTQRSMSERLKEDRLRAHMIEAAEQCGRTHVPEIAPLIALAPLLDTWPAERKLLFCDETGGADILPALQAQARGPWAILIGPEGGFTPAEADSLRAHPAALPVSLGPRILRADTAAVAAVALWQATLGDW